MLLASYSGTDNAGTSEISPHLICCLHQQRHRLRRKTVAVLPTAITDELCPSEILDTIPVHTGLSAGGDHIQELFFRQGAKNAVSFQAIVRLEFLRSGFGLFTQEAIHIVHFTAVLRLVITKVFQQTLLLLDRHPLTPFSSRRSPAPKHCCPDHLSKQNRCG